MAKYRLLNLIVRRNPCSLGRHHIHEAHMTPSMGVLAKAPTDKLLSMQGGGRDTFVARNPADVHGELPVAFVPCRCGGGYVVEPAGVADEVPGHF